MKEQEIRDRIKGFIDSVDRGVKKVILPAALGMGLALSGGGCGVEMDGPQATTEQAGKGENGGGMHALYAAPFPVADAGVGPNFDLGSPPVALYSAPFPTGDAGPVKADAEPVEADTGVNFDVGFPPVALYSAPFPAPDAGVMDSSVEPDSEIHALYAAPFPDDEEQAG